MTADLDWQTLVTVCRHLDLDAHDIKRRIETGSRHENSYCGWITRSDFGNRRTCARGATASPGYLPLCWQHYESFVNTVRSWVVNEARVGELRDLSESIAYRASQDPHVAQFVDETFGTASAESLKSRLVEIWSAA